MTNATGKRFAGYARVSGIVNERNIQTQAEAIQRWADAHDATVDIFEEVASAREGFPRKEFKRAMERTIAGDYGGIIVTRLDRFGRSAREIHREADRLKTANRDLVITGMDVDTGTPMGRVLFSMLSAFAEFDHDMICERLAEGRARARDPNSPTFNKKWNGGRPRKPLPEKEILEMVEDGATLSYLAKRWKVSKSTMKRRLKEWGAWDGGVF